MTRLSALILAAALAANLASAATPPEHLRGTLQSVAATYVTLQTTGGATQVALTSDTSYALATKSSLNAILPGSYIGTAAAGTGPDMTALEVVIFPPAMRGAGEGHYPWDKLPDTGGGAVASSMTNGTVEAGHAPQVGSSMTNGTIGTATSDAGGLHIAVAYKGGHKDIVVPASAPVVAFKVAGPGVVKKGAQAFIVAATQNGDIEAKFVAVGQDGVRPPM